VVQYGNKKDEEKKDPREDVPFEELVNLRGIRTLKTDTEEYKKRVEEFGSETPAYDPYLSLDETGEEDYYHSPDMIKEEKEPVKVKTKAEVSATPLQPSSPPISPSKTSSGYKDEEAILRESLNYLAKEISEWGQKLDYYKKNQVKVLEEKEDFVIKKEEIEKVFNPVLEKEKKVEQEVRTIEEKEQAEKTEEEKRKKEKERWAKEDERHEIEKQKWSEEEKLKTIGKLIEEKSNLYETLTAKEKEAEGKLTELHTQRERKEAQLRLIHIKALKAEIEVNKSHLDEQIRAIEKSVESLASSEAQIQAEKKTIEEKEHQAVSPEAERASSTGTLIPRSPMAPAHSRGANEIAGRFILSSRPGMLFQEVSPPVSLWRRPAFQNAQGISARPG